MSLERCDSCKGRKTIMGMGMITKKCIACNGIGYKDVAQNDEVLDSQNGKKSKPVLVKRKYKRKEAVNG